MTKTELVNKLSKRGYTKKDAAVVVNDMIDMIREILISGESIAIPGFGNFEVRETKPRRMVACFMEGHPDITIPPHKVLKFVPSVILKNEVRRGAPQQPKE